jgi:NADH-quinone oxidoreductase subunit M
MTTLELLVLLFAAGLALLLVLPEKTAAAIATGISLIGLVLGLHAALVFDKSLAGFQMLSSYEILSAYNLSLTLGADGLSLVFLLLTLFVFPVCFLAA